ncbi:hypothetical protein CAPTEDRAFT_187938 [Capitella teleta]|uniref:Uncharacterized protein n=1 Tax=Capitella teleta TaxID=283909 RepID=R7UBD6_CAPTE|nr:hypothetical protein CAPTEDRAFT_187938 [Capitella teleta]|eukprot:ELU01113.1 hypothetical protein CAPTEDRAFT_187938 [Capitella teleta]
MFFVNESHCISSEIEIIMVLSLQTYRLALCKPTAIDKYLKRNPLVKAFTQRKLQPQINGPSASPSGIHPTITCPPIDTDRQHEQDDEDEEEEEEDDDDDDDDDERRDSACHNLPSMTVTCSSGCRSSALQTPVGDNADVIYKKLRGSTKLLKGWGTEF